MSIALASFPKILGEVYKPDVALTESHMDDILQCPTEAIETLSIDHRADANLLLALAKGAHGDERIWRAGATSVFTKAILEGCGSSSVACTDRSISPCHWEVPLVGIANIISNILEEKALMDEERQNLSEKVLGELTEAYSSFVEVVWNDLGRLHQPGPEADARRHILSQALHSFSTIPEHLRLIFLPISCPHFS
jgi:hypothetical protein